MRLSSEPISGLRLLAIVLAGLWVALALAVLVAYHPGGPFDLVVRAAVFVPVPIAAAAVLAPPVGHDARESSAIGWLGLVDVLLLVPLLAGVLDTLRTEARQALFPSPEVAYAAILTVSLTCVFTALGLTQRRLAATTDRRTWIARSALLGSALTLIAALTLGLPSFANEQALVNRPATTSRFGPTDASLPLPRCEVPPPIGGRAVLQGDATAFVDTRTIEHVTLNGTRTGTTQEGWQASVTGDFATNGALFDRKAYAAQIQDADGPQSLDPRTLDMADADGLTLDGALAAYLAGHDVTRVAEDRGIELIENAPARHCRISLDGPGALAASMLVRLAIDGTVDPERNIDAWRGSIEWWVFADDELGQAVVTIGGYPGDAWNSSGLSATINARMSATNRSGSPITPSVMYPPGSFPPASPGASASPPGPALSTPGPSTSASAPSASALP